MVVPQSAGILQRPADAGHGLAHQRVVARIPSIVADVAIILQLVLAVAVGEIVVKNLAIAPAITAP